MSESPEKIVEQIISKVEESSFNYNSYKINVHQEEIIDSLRQKGYTVWGPSPGNHIAILNKNRDRDQNG